MAKPSSLLPWTVGNPNFGTVTVEPTAGKKITGFTPNERVAAELLNWLFYFIGQWIQYFDSTIDLALTSQFKAIVAASGGTHTTLTAAMADANVVPYSRIYVRDGYSVTATEQVTKNGLRIDFAPGATITKAGSAVSGLQISALDVRVDNARFSGFTNGILIDASSLRSRIMNCNFVACTNNILDNEGATGIEAFSITE